MVSFFVIIILAVLISNIFSVLSYSVNLKIIGVLLSGVIFYIAFYEVTDNNDWAIYQAMFDGLLPTADILFSWLSDWYTRNGYEYISLYRLHIVLITIGFIFYASKFDRNSILSVISIYILLQVIPLCNQIRYFFAFSQFLIASYYLLVKGNKTKFTIFAAISIMSHMGIIFMYPFYYINSKSENYLKSITRNSVILGVGVVFISQIFLAIFSQFAYYLESGQISSIAGGIFMNFIWLIWFIFLYRHHKALLAQESDLLMEDKTYVYLFRLSFYPLLFLPLSIFLQVVGHRYIAASIVVWICYYTYSLKYFSGFSRLFSINLRLLILVLFTAFYMYYLPDVLIHSNGTEALKLIVESNEFFN